MILAFFSSRSTVTFLSQRQSISTPVVSISSMMRETFMSMFQNKRSSVPNPDGCAPGGDISRNLATRFSNSRQVQKQSSIA